MTKDYVVGNIEQIKESIIYLRDNMQPDTSTHIETIHVENAKVWMAEAIRFLRYAQLDLRS